jgi:hypothetical protein
MTLVYQNNMIGGSFSGRQFQIFYTSREVSSCPLISEIMVIGKKFDEPKLYENVEETVISLRYGRRLVVNSVGSNFVKIKKDDILEIVDYDPIKGVMLVIGPKEPKLQTPVHWLVFHAKKEINAMIQIKNEEFAKKFKEKFPTTKKDSNIGIIDQAKEILFNLRNSNVVVLKNTGLLYVGKNLKDVENKILSSLEQIK